MSDLQNPVFRDAPEISEEDLEIRKKEVPPIQPTVSAGSVLIRDLRMWHRGMPNETNVPRPMIALAHCCQWYTYDGAPKMLFPKGTEHIFEHPELNSCIEFVEGKINYFGRFPILHN